MISDIFHVIYDALLQIIARLEIDISAAAIVRMLDLRIIPAVFLARRMPQALDDQRRKVCLFRSVSFLFRTICAVYIYDADCSGNHTRVLFSVVCNRGVNILLQLLHAVFVRDTAEYRFTDDFSVPVDNIGGRE